MLSNLGDPCKTISSVKFTCYNGEEVKKLSVKELTNPRSLDMLLHPTDAGLYDVALGATNRDDVCPTCKLGNVQCGGHNSYISLPVPVYHPLHFKRIHSLLRGSCFQCKKILIPRDKLLLLNQQLEAIDRGLISSFDKLQEAKNELMEKRLTSSAADVASMLEVQECLNQVFTEELDRNKENQQMIAERSTDGWSRNATDFYLMVVDEFQKLLTKTCKKCPHCKALVPSIRAELNSRFYLTEANEPTGEVQETQTQQCLTPEYVKQHLTEVWKNEREILSRVFPCLSDADTAGENSDKNEDKCKAMDVLFPKNILVPPPRYRPLGEMGDLKFENPQTKAYKEVLTDRRIILTILKKMNDQKDAENDEFNDVMEEIMEKMKSKKIDLLADIKGDTLAEKFQTVWHRLQQHINSLFDADLDKLKRNNEKERSVGIKQLLEKKEGLFRKNMMGKRVNYAARSVISPDPYIATNEIGVPLVFATRLTYPEPVTTWNLNDMRQAVKNGPKIHPGATHVIDDGRTVMLKADDPVQREAIAKKLVAQDTKEDQLGLYQPKIVVRHIQNGDYMLVNRQPTLHKGSIMAHKARVLPGEKTLRLHYANCKSYNADFDGDEMNAHFPQNELGRAEAMNIMLTDRQYLSGKDGLPLSALMQDHMVAGVTMSVRGKFFDKGKYNQLVYNALIDSNERFKTLPPAIMYPQQLWSGKQVISTVLMNIIPKDKHPLTLIGESKIKGSKWQKGPASNGRRAVTAQLKPGEMCESEVIIWKGELLCGVLDKHHYGAQKFGLVHSMYELYGGEVSGRLLTSLARLFTCFLQYYQGFTLGVADILTIPSADKKRKEIIEESKSMGLETVASALVVEKKKKQKENFATVVKEAYEDAHLNMLDPNKKTANKIAAVDDVMKKLGNDVSTKIEKVCMGEGLLRKFPENNLQLMVQSGAKGSAVNCMQISCLLGQIELEGKRPPMMASGRSFPSFKPYDTSLRAGGFVSQRFLTGIRPQEYFFHCMAGREGLIDTAVKTSTSGYLQRCLIKHMEGLMVNYDMTVRDSDGSIIQFQYGEDGVDVTKSAFLPQLKTRNEIETQTQFIIDNYLAMADSLGGFANLDDNKERKDVRKMWRKRKKAQREADKIGEGETPERRSKFLDFSKENADVGKSELMEKYRETQKLIDDLRTNYSSLLPGDNQDTVTSKFRSDLYFGSVSEKFYDRLTILRKQKKLHKLPSSDDVTTTTKTPDDHQLTIERLETMLKLKYQRSLCEPGEGVGLIAAQSIGEPSTQMTLNTFHFAGRGDMNVTLGIPRLKEILQVASKSIKTPQMTCPVLNGARIDAQRLCQKLTRIPLSKVVQKFTLEKQIKIDDNRRELLSTINFTLVSKTSIKELGLTRKQIIAHMEKRFFEALVKSCAKQLKKRKDEKLETDKKIAEDITRRSKQNEDREMEFEVDDNENEIADDDDDDDDVDEESAKKSNNDDIDEDDSDASDNDEDEEEKDSASRDSDGEDNKEQPQEKTTTVDFDDNRITRVKNIRHESTYVMDYQVDINTNFCQLDIVMPLTDCDINVASVVQQEITHSCVRSVKGISRAIMVAAHNGAPASEDDADDLPMKLITEGLNFTELFKNQHIVDVNKIYSNCVHSMASIYGIEAARTVIVKEIGNVFGVYGIKVDPRHLSLIGDFMTNEGSYKAFNRQSMSTCSSPLQQMSFETTMRFLNAAVLRGSVDNLRSPSARIVTGQVVKNGTGNFELMYPISSGAGT